MNGIVIRGLKLLLAASLFFACLAGSLFAAAAFESGQGKAVLTVRQIFNCAGSSAAPQNGVFAYRLTPEQTSVPMPAGSGANGYDFTITGTDDIDVGPIIFTQMGKYTYEISHIPDGQPDYIHNQETYTLDIWVDNKLNVAVVVYNKEGNKAADIIYEHSCGLLPSDPALMEDTPVVKTVSGSPAEDSDFTFRLEPGDPANPMPEGSENGVKTLRVTGSGQGGFGTWGYTAEGTYFYTVYEVNDGLPGYNYDDSVYTIADSVKEADGKLGITRVVTNSANRQVASLSFINIYTDGSGKPDGPDNPGKPGPATGDEARTMLYVTLICTAAATAVGSTGYLLSGRRRGKETDKNEG
ncbi:MAG: hypothetical protein FWF08_04535 [Oscillospiraceae bacterium]|nr:hypothetical protein [Oscillospiraceae bacterium]